MHQELFFSNGAKVSLSKGGDGDVAIKAIERLRFSEVAKDFLAISNGSLCVEMPSAETALGIELGYTWTREGREIQQDLFWIDSPNPGEPPRISIEVESPAVESAGEAQSLLEHSTHHASISLAKLSMHEADGRKYLSIDLEVAPTSTIAEIGSHCHLIMALLRSSKESVHSPIAIFRQLAAGNLTSLI